MATASTPSGSGNTTNSPLNFPYFTNQSNLNGGMGNYSVVAKNGALKSLFNKNTFIPYPIGVNANGDASGSKQNIHTDDIYDTSIISLIDYTKKYKSMRLTAAHFAYLKNRGVYPNNRLLIARRFSAPVGNDLTSVSKSEPLATLISWVPDNNNFLEFTVGEKWTEAEASFENVLNKFGKDISLSSDNHSGMGSLGSIAAGAFGAIPLPGLMEGLQRKLFVRLGIVDPKSAEILPGGNPNLIREARQRVTLDKNSPGSGLICSFTVKMKVEYVQDYVNGVDPTLAYFDLLSNVLSFATSDSQFMYNNAFAKGGSNIISNLISGDIKTVQETLKKWISTFISVMEGYIGDIVKAVQNIVSPESKSKDTANNVDSLTISNLFKNTIGSTIGKYKIALLGIISSLTGVASTPWHITIGNPKRPFFCSGDMYMDSVSVAYGPILSFNDLPSSVTIEFELKNARNLGAQEIMNRFNTGKGRSYSRLNDINSSNTLGATTSTYAVDATNNSTQLNNNSKITSVPSSNDIGYSGFNYATQY